MTFRIHSKNGSPEEDKIISRVSSLSPDAVAAKIENSVGGSILKIDHKGLSDVIRMFYIFCLVPMIYMADLVQNQFGSIGMIIYIALMLVPIDLKAEKFWLMIFFNIVVNVLIFVYQHP